MFNAKNFLQSEEDRWKEVAYWSQLSQICYMKEKDAWEDTPIDYIDFSPNEPHNFAVTCSACTVVYDPITKLPTSKFLQFQKRAHGGKLSQNGQLLVCGDDTGFVKLFETSTQRNIHSFNQHTAAVHRTFFTKDESHIASFSDDKTVRLWDISNGICVKTFENAHTECIRAGCVNPISSDILLSGGHDKKVKMYDTRSKSVSFDVDHGSPVHSVMFLPFGGIFISCGDSDIKLWDAIAGGRLMAKMSTLSTDITCLQLACNGSRLLSGGLDGKLNIYDTKTYETVHHLDFMYPITSVAVSPTDEILVVGMDDSMQGGGIVSVQRMDSDRKITTLEKRKKPRTYQGRNENYKQTTEAVTHNQMLDETKYFETLQNALTNDPSHIVVGLMSELMRGRVLERALQGSPDDGSTNDFLINFISFLIRNVCEPRFTRELIYATNCLLNVYEDKFSSFNSDVVIKFKDLSRILAMEVQLLSECIELKGALTTVISATE